MAGKDVKEGMGKEVVLLTSDKPLSGKVRKVIGLVVAARPVSLTVAGIEEEIEALLEKLSRLAAAKGANAVLDVRIDIRSVSGAGLEWALLMAYGTAVVIETEER